MPGLFLSGESVGVGDRYTMSKKEEMEVFYFQKTGEEHFKLLMVRSFL